MTNKSHLERTFDFQILAAGLPEPVCEYTFAKPRRWRFDRCWPDKMVAVEIEGGVWNFGRHNRPSGFIQDCIKYNEAALLGWTVLRFPSVMVENGTALDMLERALNGAGDAD